MNTSLTINKIDNEFSTAAQISADDMAQIAAQGFKTLISCRPDFEAGTEQPTAQLLTYLATHYGLKFAHFPVLMGTSGQEFAPDMAAYLLTAPKPVLAFCRSGMRAGKLYSLAKDILVNQSDLKQS